jgi:outer membrane lipoprotein SlyB
MNKVSAFMLVVFIFLSACASKTGWEPTVDPHNDPNPDLIAAHTEECRQLADKASGGTLTQAGVGTAVGAGIGAVVGAVIGAVSGNAGGGAATGAAVGGTGAGVSSGAQAEAVYKDAFKRCMQNRGHRLLN